MTVQRIEWTADKAQILRRLIRLHTLKIEIAKKDRPAMAHAIQLLIKMETATLREMRQGQTSPLSSSFAPAGD